MTQQNTASAEEAAASEELSGQAMQMKEMMARFKVRKLSADYNRPQHAFPESMATSTASQFTGQVNSVSMSGGRIALEDSSFNE